MKYFSIRKYMDKIYYDEVDIYAYNLILINLGRDNLYKLIRIIWMICLYIWIENQNLQSRGEASWGTNCSTWW